MSRELIAQIIDAEAFDHPDVHPQHLKSRRAAALAKADQIIAALSPGEGSGEALAAICQACGGGIEGWSCQSCDRQFKENDDGWLVFAHPAPRREVAK